MMNNYLQSFCITCYICIAYSATRSCHRLLSAEPVPSGGGPFVQPSETHCTQICGLQVAAVVGLEGDPLGRNVLGLPASVPVIVVVAEVVGTVEVMTVAPSTVTVGTSSGSSNVTT